MNAQEHHPNDKLQKSSIIFMQLGLILAMLFVYATLEIQVEQKKFSTVVPESDSTDTFILPEIPVFEIERVQEPVVTIEPPQYVDPGNDFTLVDDNTPIIEPPVNPTEPTEKDDTNVAIESLPGFTDEPDDDPVLFILLEEVPVYPGCEGLNNKEAKICFTKKITRFVSKKFNTNVASEAGLHGKQNINVQFVIDKHGNVTDIQVRAPHKALEKETRKMIEKLPQMIPGMQRKRPVPVKYTLPIRFEVY